VTDEAAKPEKSVHEMTVEDILNSDTYVTAFKEFWLLRREFGHADEYP
jgi:hypothetical protein